MISLFVRNSNCATARFDPKPKPRVLISFLRNTLLLISDRNTLLTYYNSQNLFHPIGGNCSFIPWFLKFWGNFTYPFVSCFVLLQIARPRSWGIWLFFCMILVICHVGLWFLKRWSDGLWDVWWWWRLLGYCCWIWENQKGLGLW